MRDSHRVLPIQALRNALDIITRPDLITKLINAVYVIPN